MVCYERRWAILVRKSRNLRFDDQNFQKIHNRFDNHISSDISMPRGRINDLRNYRLFVFPTKPKEFHLEPKSYAGKKKCYHLTSKSSEARKKKTKPSESSNFEDMQNTFRTLSYGVQRYAASKRNSPKLRNKSTWLKFPVGFQKEGEIL